MRILLDESLPRDLSALLVGHDAITVGAAGWSGVKNGELLALAAACFDVFVTADRNIEFQQNLATLPISIVVLVVRRTRIQAIEPVVPELLRLLNHIAPRTLRKVGG
jgi:predicted nuclease of predicted toxin-antitoxin system